VTTKFYIVLIVNVKVSNLLEKNPGLPQMKAIKNIHTGFLTEIFLDIDHSPMDLVIMKFSPITSVEVE